MAAKKPVVTEEPEVNEQPQETGEKEAVKEQQPEKKEAKDASFFMYLGPNITGVIQYGTIYSGSREEAEARIDRAIQKHPEIKVLLVEGDRIAAAREEIKKAGTRLNRYYQRLVNGLKT